MAKDANEIRNDIEYTRSRLGDTVEAIGYKADVPTRAKEAVADGVDAVKHAVSDTASKLADAMPSSDDLRAGADKVAGFINENPVGVAVGAVAVGFLMGLLLPRTSIEADRVEDVKRMAKDAGSQVVEASKQMVIDTVSTTLRGPRS